MKRCLRLSAALLLVLALLSGHALAFDPIPYEMAPAPYEPHQECFLPDDAGYHDDSIDIRIETFRYNESTVMAAYVTIADPSQIRTGSADPNRPLSTTAVTTDRMAKRYNAVMAINSDWFTYQSSRKGVIIRNGRMLRENYSPERDTLIIDANGDLTIIPTTKEAFEAFDGEIIHAFWFGPGLVVDGVQLTAEEIAEMRVSNLAPNKRTQRIAFCQLGPLSYLILATEGPENPGSTGFTILEMAELCMEMGAVNAYNLDGGSSSSIALNYRKINSLSTHKNRSVGDIIYFCTLVP